MNKTSLLASVVIFAFSAPLFAQERKPVAVPPELAARAESHQLKSTVWSQSKTIAEMKAQIADLTARLDSITLNATAPALQQEREQLAAFLSATACGVEDAPIDWAQSPPVVMCQPKSDKADKSDRDGKGQ